MRPGTLLLIATVLTAAGGCRPDFAPYNRLTALRVLGIQSEPPTPATGETATLSALVFTPTPDDPTLTYSWSWCPFPGSEGDGYPCLISYDQLTAFAAGSAMAVAIPPFDLGAAPTATLPNAIPAEFLASACNGMPGLRAPDCTGGIPIQISLTVTTSNPATGRVSDQVDTVFTTRWRFLNPLTGNIPEANANPTIDNLSAAGEDIPQTSADATVAAITLPRNTATPLRATVAMTTAEMFTGPDDSGNPSLQTERLFMTWFVETGGTDHSRTSFLSANAQSPDELVTLFDTMLKNTWSPELKKNYASDVARLFVVIHDSRNGIGWRSGFVNLEPMP